VLLQETLKLSGRFLGSIQTRQHIRANPDARRESPVQVVHLTANAHDEAALPIQGLG